MELLCLHQPGLLKPSATKNYQPIGSLPGRVNLSRSSANEGISPDLESTTTSLTRIFSSLARKRQHDKRAGATLVSRGCASRAAASAGFQ